MKIKNKNVLVLGGSGFIGSHTVDALVTAGANVLIIDNLSTGRKENLNPKATFYNINIADSQVEKIMDEEKPEYIYNFSFFVLVPKSIENPLLDIDNMIGTIRVMQKAKDLKVKKVIYSSSGFVYGNTKDLPVKESAPIDPVTPYVVTKNTAENYLRYYNKAFGLPYVLFRYPAVYGPRQVTGAMADYIRKLSKGDQADIWGDGNKTRDYVYVQDVVNANLLALDVDNSHSNPVFNVGTGKETTLNEVYFKIAELLKKQAKPKYHPDRSGEQLRYSLDSKKLRDELGWKVNYNLNDGLKLTLKYWGLI